ncbi:MAG TPA: YciI family protein [Solirubrobacteraceae bacterium]|nr:YciI family protein [Solirubrobacteraceae bacterium]
MSDSGPHQILFYDYVDDVLARRDPHRDAHLALLRAERDAGRVVMAGAVGDPVSGAMFVFRGADPEPAETFARRDPYMEAGLVTGWRIEPWNVVVA